MFILGCGSVNRQVRAQPAARQMAMKSAAFSEAPPIRPPSMSGCGEELRRVVGLDAAAVEDAASRRRAACAALQLRAQQRMHRLRLLGRGGLAGADGPDRLVGDDAAGDAMRRACRSPPRAGARPPLRSAPASRSASVSPTQTMGTSPCSSAALALSATSCVALAVQRAPLGVADDDVAAAELGQHRRRDLAGVRARLVARAVLRAPARWRCPRARARLRPGRRRRAHRDVGAGRAGRAAARPAARRWRRALPFIFQLPTTSLRRIVRCAGSRRYHASTSLPMCVVRLHQRMRLRPPRPPGRPRGSPA